MYRKLLCENIELVLKIFIEKWNLEIFDKSMLINKNLIEGSILNMKHQILTF